MIIKALKSKLFRSSGIYTLSSIVNASIPFLLIPILTRVLSPSDYGIVSMAVILINIITPFLGISSHAAIQRKFYELSEVEFAEYVGNSFFLLVGSSFFFLILFVFFNSTISNIAQIPGKWLYAVLIIGISQFLSLILLTIWQVKQTALNFGLFQVGQSILNFALTLLLVLLLNYGWQGRILGQLVAVFFGAIFSLYYLYSYKLIKFNLNMSYIKDILKYCLPLIPHTLGGLLIAFTDRILIANIVGIKETGVYTLGYQIGSVVGIITSSFNSAYIPWLYEKLTIGNINDKIKIVKFTYFYMLMLLLGALLSVLFIPFLISIIATKEFEGAGIYTFWIVLGYAFNGMYLMVSGFVFYSNRTDILSKITFLTAIINIPLCYFMLVHFGTIGVAVSMSIIFAISFISTWVISARIYKMPWLSFWKHTNQISS